MDSGAPEAVAADPIRSRRSSFALSTASRCSRPPRFEAALASFHRVRRRAMMGV
jgi:hypothetical protein